MKLVADIGGTSLRVAVARRDGDSTELTEIREVAMASLHDIGGWLCQYIDALPQSPQSCALAVAGPVQGEGAAARVRMTNLPLDLSAAGIAKQLCMPVRIVNDFTAVSLGIPHLPASGLDQVADGVASPGRALAVLGPGTGLGVSGLLPSADGYAVIAGEGGHVSLATGGEAQEQAVLAILRQATDFVGAEDVLCGTHLPRLYRAVCCLRGEPPRYFQAAAIASAAFVDAEPAALDTLRLFTLWLGRCAGDLALTLGARAGVYLAGGILPKWGDGFDKALFTQGFRDKGSFRDYVTEIPVWLVTHPYPALLGLASL